MKINQTWKKLSLEVSVEPLADKIKPPRGYGYCKWCGEIFKKHHNRQTYCCKEHRHYGDMELTAKRVRKYRTRYCGVVTAPDYQNIGYGGLGEHAVSDSLEEYQRIQRELERLHLRKRR